jgi:hypothetical protein
MTEEKYNGDNIFDAFLRDMKLYFVDNFVDP